MTAPTTDELRALVPDDRITDRPWRGACATTGLTMDDFRERLSIADVPELPTWITRAAVSICRSYGLGRGLSDPAYVANVIAGELERADWSASEREFYARVGRRFDR